MDSAFIYRAANELVQNVGTRNIKQIARSCSLDISETSRIKDMLGLLSLYFDKPLIDFALLPRSHKNMCISVRCIYDCIILSFICIQLSLVLQIVCVQTNLNAIQQVGNHLGISANRNALIKCIEIVVIKSQTNWKALNNKRRQLFAVASPLLLGVALDELLVNVPTDEGDGLLFQVLRLTSNLLALFLNLRGSLLRCHNTPHFVECVHIERK